MSWTILDSRWVKTRKAHECDGCYRRWPKGSKMYVYVGLWEGDPPIRTRLCEVCTEFMRSCLSADSDETLPEEPWWDLYEEEYVKLEESSFVMPVVIAGVKPAISLLRERREGR